MGTDRRRVSRVGRRRTATMRLVDEYRCHWLDFTNRPALTRLAGIMGPLADHLAIRSDNGSCFISRAFGGVLDEHGLHHRRIKPHCPGENGTMERTNRTLEEALEGEGMTSSLERKADLARVIRWYNEKWLYSALGFLRPVDYYRGDPAEMYAERRRKLAAARHRRKEENLRLPAANAALLPGGRCTLAPARK